MIDLIHIAFLSHHSSGEHWEVIVLRRRAFEIVVRVLFLYIIWHIKKEARLILRIKSWCLSNNGLLGDGLLEDNLQVLVQKLHLVKLFYIIMLFERRRTRTCVLSGAAGQCLVPGKSSELFSDSFLNYLLEKVIQGRPPLMHHGVFVWNRKEIISVARHTILIIIISGFSGLISF